MRSAAQVVFTFAVTWSWLLIGEYGRVEQVRPLRSAAGSAVGELASSTKAATSFLGRQDTTVLFKKRNIRRARGPVAKIDGTGGWSTEPR